MEESYKLEELLRLFWEKKNSLISSSIIFLIISLIYSLYLNDIYRSEAIIDIKEKAFASNTQSDLGGLSSFIGLPIPSSRENKSSLVIETIKSRDFLRQLLEKDDLLVYIMASSNYDKERNIIDINEEYFDTEKSEWIRNVEAPRKKKPSYLEAHEVYLDNMSIRLNRDSGFIHLSYDHISPVFAEKMVKLIIKEVDNKMRQEDLIRSKESIQFLNNKWQETNISSLKNSITELINNQLETQMLANVGENYLVSIIEPPFIPEKKISPSRTLIVVLGSIFGLILSMIYFLWKYIRK